MTREEAIKYIKSRCIGSTEERDGTQWSEAMWTAIEALQTESVTVFDFTPILCEDCEYGQYDCTHMYCDYFGHKVYEDDYCSNAVRRSNAVKRREP